MRSRDRDAAHSGRLRSGDAGLCVLEDRDLRRVEAGVELVEREEVAYCLSEEDSLIILGKIPTIRTMVLKDIEAAFIKDPAAKSYEEVAITYPGIFASNDSSNFS